MNEDQLLDYLWPLQVTPNHHIIRLESLVGASRISLIFTDEKGIDHILQHWVEQNPDRKKHFGAHEEAIYKRDVSREGLYVFRLHRSGQTESGK